MSAIVRWFEYSLELPFFGTGMKIDLFQWKQGQAIFLGSKVTTDGDCSHEIKRHLLLGRKAMTNRDSILKSRDIILLTKIHLTQSYGFSSSRVWMWEMDYEDSWAPKNWCFWTVVLEKTPESPLVCKEIQPVHPKGDQPWIFIGRTDAEPEAPILWPPYGKNWLIRKDLDAGKDRTQEEKGVTEDDLVGWHHQLNGREFKEVLGVGDGQGSLNAAVYGVTKSRTQLSNQTKLNWYSARKSIQCYVMTYIGKKILERVDMGMTHSLCVYLKLIHCKSAICQ